MIIDSYFPAILRAELEALKVELIQKYDQLKMRASGQFAESLEVKVEDTPTGFKGVILGMDYGQQLETGRRPNNGSSGKKWENPIEDISQWIVDKGLASSIEGYVRDRSLSGKAERQIKVSSLAYLIVRKIFEKGWKREEHGGVELISQVITPEVIQKIIDKVGDVYTTRFTTQIVTELKQALQ